MCRQFHERCICAAKLRLHYHTVAEEHALLATARNASQAKVKERFTTMNVTLELIEGAGCKPCDHWDAEKCSTCKDGPLT